MSIHPPVIMLPDWAFRALAASDIHILVERCALETIMVMRRGRPDLVMMSHATWATLTGTDGRDLPEGNVETSKENARADASQSKASHVL